MLLRFDSFLCVDDIRFSSFCKGLSETTGLVTMLLGFITASSFSYDVTAYSVIMIKCQVITLRVNDV